MRFDPFDEDDDEAADRDLRRSIGKISPVTLREFVLLAVLIQVGLFAASLGLMLAAFRGQDVFGGALVGIGALALALAAAVYLRRRARRRE
ncbi:MULTISPECIES: DUF7322 domain-containing protein [Halorussus]|uniref:DUF7322 domain-containing protein n=1 Tax=Halorussus TaxID=1070314 RepID=UPI00209FEA89|nr:hypothetical protein [Halorussus vallis]USZ75839.1 hypothetical protein NGM07_00610 [Halorussus vallis]